VVFSVAFHPDGKRLASASFDKTVRLWDLATHKTLTTLSGHSDFVYAVAFNADGKWLVSASKDRSVKLVETDTGKSRFTFSLDDDVLTVTVSPDGKNVISSGFQPSLFWWDPTTGQRVRAQGGHGVATHEVCFSKDGKLLASAGADRTVRLWNGGTGALLQTLPANSVAYAVALSPDGKRVAAGCFDGLIRLWDTASARPLVTLLALPPEGDKYDWLAVTPEGYTSGSAGLTALGQWRMAGQAVTAETVWKALRQPDAVAKSARGETVTPPVFGK
jgi:WD40 repeat protein